VTDPGPADEAAITRVLLRYCRGADRCDEELIRSAYHPDAIDIHGSYKGSAAEYAAWAVETSLARYDATQHLLGNVILEFGPPGTAFVESAFIGVHVPKGAAGRRIELLGGRYVDLFERRAGDWRISRRTVVVDWSSVHESDGQFPAIGSFVAGRRDRTDVSYERDPGKTAQQ
jgi:hypothetical protein